MSEQCNHEFVGYKQCCYCGAFENARKEIKENRIQANVESLRKSFEEWYFSIKKESGEPPLAMQIFHFFETKISLFDALSKGYNETLPPLEQKNKYTGDSN